MQVEKPKKKSPIRRKLGKEFYVFKRWLQWYSSTRKYAKVEQRKDISQSVFHHQSMILRPLKNVDMYLQENKRTNLRLAIQHINSVVLEPGQTFSLWKLVGRPSKRKGYLPGLILHQGTISSDTGGGLCQLGNLLFWIAAHSNLTITERYRHGYDVFPDVNRKVPFGAGATLAFNYIDLQFKNETENTFQLKLWLDDTHLHGELFSKDPIDSVFKVEERDHIIQQQIWGGYTRHNRIIQIETNDGQSHAKLLVENHAIMMYSPLLEQKKRSPILKNKN